MMFDVVDKKKSLWTTKVSLWDGWKMCIFAWGKIPKILVKNLKILSNLFLFQKGLDIMVDGILDKKEVFLDYKNVLLRFS